MFGMGAQVLLHPYIVTYGIIRFDEKKKPEKNWKNPITEHKVITDGTDLIYLMWFTFFFYHRQTDRLHGLQMFRLVCGNS